MCTPECGAEDIQLLTFTIGDLDLEPMTLDDSNDTVGQAYFITVKAITGELMS